MTLSACTGAGLVWPKDHPHNDLYFYCSTEPQCGPQQGLVEHGTTVSRLASIWLASYLARFAKMAVKLGLRPAPGLGSTLNLTLTGKLVRLP